MRKAIIHTLWRLLAALIGIGFIAGGVMVILHAMEVINPIQGGGAGFSFLLDLGQETFRVVLAWVGGSVIAIAAGLLLLLLALIRAVAQNRQIVLSSPVSDNLYGRGEVTISLQSVRALAAYTAENVPGIREAVPQTRLKRGGWHIDCQVVLIPNVSLPEVTLQLKNALQQAIEHHTGLSVARVNIAAQLNAIDAQRRLH